MSQVLRSWTSAKRHVDAEKYFLFLMNLCVQVQLARKLQNNNFRNARIIRINYNKWKKLKTNFVRLIVRKWEVSGVIFVQRLQRRFKLLTHPGTQWSVILPSLFLFIKHLLFMFDFGWTISAGCIDFTIMVFVFLNTFSGSGIAPIFTNYYCFKDR